MSVSEEKIILDHPKSSVLAFKELAVALAMKEKIAFSEDQIELFDSNMVKQLKDEKKLGNESMSCTNSSDYPLNIYLWNANSLHKKLSFFDTENDGDDFPLEELINKCEKTIFCITHSGFTNEKEFPNIKKHKLVHYRSSKGGHGICCLLPENIPYSYLENESQSKSDLDVLCIDLFPGTKNSLRLIIIYSNSISKKSLVKKQKELMLDVPRFISLGDFNFGKKEPPKYYTKFMKEWNLKKYVLYPTFPSGSTLDQVYTNQNVEISNMIVLPFDLTRINDKARDHKAVKFQVFLPDKQSVKKLPDKQSEKEKSPAINISSTVKNEFKMLAKKFTGTKVLDNEISEIAHLIGQSSILKTARIVDEKQFTIILRGSYLELDNLPEEENDLNIFFQNLLDNCNIETYEPTGVQQQILDQILQQNGSVSKDDGLHAIMNNEQLSLKYGEIIIDKDDLSSLSNKRWLTDSIIYGYLYLISEFTAENQDLPDAFTFPAQFFTSPEEYGKKFLERQDIDLSEYERLLFPCHVNNSHWTLFIVNFEDESINYFDSLGGEIPEQYQTKLSEFISQTANETNINWNFKTKEKRPKQKNEYDCGVFVCKYAEYYCKNLPKKVDQQDMPEFRNEILRRLCAKKLSD